MKRGSKSLVPKDFFAVINTVNYVNDKLGSVALTVMQRGSTRDFFYPLKRFKHVGKSRATSCEWSNTQKNARDEMCTRDLRREL